MSLSLKNIFGDKRFLAAVLVVLGLATRLIFLTNPAEVVFDEVHFGKFVSSYFTGKYYFDIHPPLGKMIVAAGASLGSYGDYIFQNGVFDFKNIGDDFGAMPFLWFRIFPALAGALIPLAVFLFANEFGLGKFFSFFVGLLILLENSLLVESRLILMDSFLILFGFLGLYFFFKSRNNGYPPMLLVVSGLFLSLSFSVKWTGLGFWGAAGMIYVWDLLTGWFNFFLPTRRLVPAASRGAVISADDSFGDQARQLPITKKKLNQPPREFLALVLRRLSFGALTLIILPFLLYFAVFQIHFALLPECPGKDEGNGCDFMSQEFRQNKLNQWQEFSELNRKMWVYNKGISASHEYGSKALGWPLMIRSVYYWVQNVSEGVNSRIYMIGNPINWFFGLLGIFTFMFVPIAKDKKIILALLFLANFLPFILVKRVLFLYHYLFALSISLVIFAFVFEEMVKKFSLRHQLFVASCLLSVVCFGFLFFAPLSYGLSLTDEQFKDRQWSGLWFSGNNQLKQLCENNGCSVLKWILY